MGAVWLWLWRGDARSPRFCLTGDQTTRCTPFAKSAQALTEQQTYLKSAHVHTANTCRVALVITAPRKSAWGTLPPLSLITMLESPCPLPLLQFSVFSKKKNVAFIRSKKNPKRCLYLGCCLYSVQFFFEVYALIRSVAFIRVLLLFGGGVPPF